MAAATATLTEAQQHAADAAWRPKANIWAIALTVTLATFMEVLDSSIANVALPHIAGSLGASQDEATWVLTSYLVSNAVILPASAYLTTFIGRKKFYMICVVLFGVSSMLCGLAPSLPILIFCRVLQGAGGGGLAPSEQAILADTFTPKQRGQAFALYGLAVVCAPAIGPSLGGWITDNYNWRWIFFINVPIAMLSLYLTNRLVEDPPHVTREVAESKKGGLQLDLMGFGLLAAGFGSLEFILDKGQEDDWFASHIIVFFFWLCVISLITLVFWELYQIRVGNRPILNLTLFKRRTFSIPVILMFVLGFSLYGTTVLIPQFVQTLLGYTAQLAGQVISPGGICIMLMMPVVGFLIGRTDPRWLICFGFSILATSMIWMHQALTLESSFKYIMWLRVYQASGLAFLFIPINTISYTGVARAQNNDVAGLTNLARNIGGSVGTAFVATMLSRGSQRHEAYMIRHLTPGSPNFDNQVGMLKGFFGGHSGGNNLTGPGVYTAQAYIYNLMHRQSAMLAYLDIIAIFAVFCTCMIPLVLLIGKIKPAADGPAMH
ncbi:MFS transporter, DHA2 family, multidrug resistance protein [Granulicella rosea]|uniref:MFS transporter, DHA2 family, multidrug resistance protein n=1 Tax=Granulicella rosea TaxID=474952 RepID=A0A239LPJ3_9BACT|nr:DHA2 family efflux MFS transporter permease subunit [Granulicella rosea]SNT31798.1 MFS transporter, DHA2 family, multidrug resistance protein [Granulicella rosea]